MRLSFWGIETHDRFFKVVVCEWSYGVTLEADFRDGLGPPVDDEEAVVAATHAHTRHRTTLQTLVADVTHEVQIARQTLDSWVTCAKKMTTLYQRFDDVFQPARGLLAVACIP